jgi:hypothetical protein
MTRYPTRPPEALVHEKSMVEGDKNVKNLPHPFPGFAPRDDGEQEQIQFLPSPTVPEDSGKRVQEAMVTMG